MLDKSINACFRKLRVKERVVKSSIDMLMAEKKVILKQKKLSKEDEKKINEIETSITNEIAEKEYQKLSKVIGKFESETNTNIWRELKKAYPKVENPLPTGVKNMSGKVITNPKEKSKITSEHFNHRMRKRMYIDNVEEVAQINEDLFNARLKEAKENISHPLKKEELDKVIKGHKIGKCKDPDNYIFELFSDGVIGDDLRNSLLIMMNKMKDQMKIPDTLKNANITILHEKKDKLDLNNWRGIFVTSVIRAILMKMIYGRTYQTVDQNMSDAQIGARKGKSVRNHLFVLNAILSDVMSSKKKQAIDINILDFKQMFDAEEISNVLNAFYEVGIKDDMLALLNEANENVTFAVKTPSGLTETKSISNKVMQGDVMAPLLSSNFVDMNIVKPAIKNRKYFYVQR